MKGKKKSKGLAWKIVLVIGMILFSVIVFYCLRNVYLKKYGEYWYRNSLSASCELITYRNGEVRVFNTEVRKKTTPRLNWLANVNSTDSTTVFAQNGKRGYLNLRDGEIFIPAQFDKAWIFSEGLAAVVKNKKLGFINTQGDLVIPYQYYYDEFLDGNIDFVFKDGLCNALDSTRRHGLINPKEEWMVEPTYDYIFNPVKGYRAVKKNDLFGVIDSLQCLIVPIEYKWIKVTNEGLIMMKDDVQYLSSFDGKNIIQPFIYDHTNEIHYTSKQLNEVGDDIIIRCDFTAYEMHGLWGLIDENGEVVVSAKYSEITAIKNNLFSCKTGNYWITINSKGNTIH